MEIPSDSCEVTARKDQKRRRSVNFASADIIEFEPTVWTASVPSGGVPVS